LLVESEHAKIYGESAIEG